MLSPSRARLPVGRSLRQFRSDALKTAAQSPWYWLPKQPHHRIPKVSLVGPAETPVVVPLVQSNVRFAPKAVTFSSDTEVGARAATSR
jgi:hypothetical protein